MGTLLSLPQTFRKAVDCLGPFTYLGSYDVLIVNPGKTRSCSALQGR